MDLAIGIGTITALSVLAFGVGRYFTDRLGSAGPACFAITLLLALCFAWTFSGRLLWAVIFPTASVIFWSNLMPLLLSLAAGLSSKTPGLANWHRPATIAALLMLAVGYTLTPVARRILAPVQLAAVQQWRGDVCLQSHPSTCAPAAAATLLRLEGIEADERGFTAACLTSQQGTTPLGLYRGLALISRRYDLQPHVASSDPKDWTEGQQLPNIALVRFADSTGRGSLRRLLGPRGEGHAIVVLARDCGGSWIIADPAFGETRWSDQEFRDRFTGEAIYVAGKVH